ncbi:MULTISPECIES: hypothetical protein [Pseudoalteromonas]|uniref:Secreted protein n=1 Tax=Pseudoalteromonas ruthenica TaxID=151081 RepID=A0A0F4PTY7_9GAMM|nr:MULTISPECIES: hypothetical protein [Pseudoalteromonas]KJY96713.1 hypothetical protein TW76_11690 [Pseudoalteromonas ruthenica]KJY98584.1 hypothetical protein TW72_12705 [Pseudoalteromonas ruthenica]MCF2862150.1 hypothetical protein [Pseudoalteromonas sp. CNAT2-18]MCG7543589.1 hypothetical protein [Pseudoalteromonas sp. MM17-2]MCG7558081.1 hypothetical protein [Pseudoalteromonas sp. CNAT2-18.1]
MKFARIALITTVMTLSFSTQAASLAEEVELAVKQAAEQALENFVQAQREALRASVSNLLEQALDDDVNTAEKSNTSAPRS